MAVFSVKDQDKYGGQGGGGFFSLKDDRETAKVRILLDSPEDVKGYSVHEVDVDGRKRYVNCLHEYGNSKDDCPFCAKGKFNTVKYYVPIYNLDQDKMQVWERGRKFGPELEAHLARYPHLYARTTEIERLGKPKDTATTYRMYSGDVENDVYLEDFDVQDPVGSVILDKSFDDMEYYLKHGSFPDADVSERPQRASRDERPTRDERPSQDERPVRDDRSYARPQRSGRPSDRF